MHYWQLFTSCSWMERFPCMYMCVCECFICLHRVMNVYKYVMPLYNEACTLYINNIVCELDLAVTFHSPLSVGA